MRHHVPQLVTAPAQGIKVTRISTKNVGCGLVPLWGAAEDMSAKDTSMSALRWWLKVVFCMRSPDTERQTCCTPLDFIYHLKGGVYRRP